MPCYVLNDFFTQGYKHLPSFENPKIWTLLDIYFLFQQFDLHDNHPELIVHWAGENSDMIVCLTRDIDQTDTSTTEVYFSNNYGKTFVNKTSLHLDDGTKPIFDRFYHSPANNMRVSTMAVWFSIELVPCLYPVKGRDRLRPYHSRNFIG